jgi:F420-dependent oxidoreductase-like protein
VPPLRFGVCVPQDLTDPGELRALAQTAEQLGYHSLWLYDHFRNFPSSDFDPILEPWTLMSVLAASTATIRIGTLVLCQAFRPPALLAKMAATLDVLSGGRLEFGYGAGWHQEEFTGYGYDFPPIATRIRQMEEGLTVIKKLWTEARPSWNGRFHRIEDAVCEPKPVQRPHPPITIGGGGEQLLLRAVARHADTWNYVAASLPEYEQKARVLAAHCQAIGRDPQTIDRSLLIPTITADAEKDVRDQLEAAKAQGYLWAFSGHYVQGTPDIVVPRYRDYLRRGVSLFIVRLPNSRDLKQIEYVAHNVMRELLE